LRILRIIPRFDASVQIPLPYGAVKGMRFALQRLGADGKWEAGGEHRLPAHTIFVCTQPQFRNNGDAI